MQFDALFSETFLMSQQDKGANGIDPTQTGCKLRYLDEAGDLHHNCDAEWNNLYNQVSHWGLDFEHPFNLREGESKARFCFRFTLNIIRGVVASVDEGRFQMIDTTTNELFVGYKAFSSYLLYIHNAPK